MADVRPFKALRYDLGKVGGLEAVAAPPYDVIDARMREELLARSPYNAVAIDLPKPYDGGPVGEGDPYEEAAAKIDAWRRDGALVAEQEPTLWALSQDYTGPDGAARTRHAVLARVRVEDYDGSVRPHERTLPGPLEDRLRLTRATGHNLSPIFSLASEDPWPLVAAAIEGEEPFGEVRDEDGTLNRLWRVADPAVHAAVTELLAPAELLIADGHHRYETARAFRDEVGGEGPHEYTLMALTGLDDPGLTVFATHRLLAGFAADPERQQRLGAGLRELFDAEPIDAGDLDPAGEPGVGVFGLYDSHHRQAYRLRLRDVAALDARLDGKPEAYRRLDSAILETLVLKGLAGLSEDDILAKRGIGYAKNVPDSLALLEDGSYDVAFFLRPIPVEQVRAIAASAENMPPKSTFFFPKVMTGFAFNPVG